jgi:hypothetical protein
MVSNKLRSISFTENKLSVLRIDHESAIKMLFVKELTLTNSCNTMSAKSTQMLEELDWLNHQLTFKLPISNELQAQPIILDS